MGEKHKMVMDICRVCKGDCCKEFPLYYAESRKSAYKSSPLFKEYPFIHEVTEYPKDWQPSKLSPKVGTKLFTCDNYDEKNGKCKDYENRPSFCKKFICNKAVEILDLVQEPWRKPTNAKN